MMIPCLDNVWICFVAFLLRVWCFLFPVSLLDSSLASPFSGCFLKCFLTFFFFCLLCSPRDLFLSCVIALNSSRLLFTPGGLTKVWNCLLTICTKHEQTLRNTKDRRLSAQNQYRHDMGYAPSSFADPCYGGTGPQLGLHRASTGSIGSDGSVEGVGLGMQSHGRYEHRQPSLQEQKRGERMGWDIGEHFDV